MPIDAVLEELFDTEITISQRTSSHTTAGYPKPGYGTAVTYSAHIERAEEFVRTEQGSEAVGRRHVFLYCSTGWTVSNIPRVTDKITLPDTHQPTTPQILAVRPVSDEFGVSYVKIITEP